jgi:RNA polymerase-interacting CarD/CdnL/TRCF family regulator
VGTVQSIEGMNFSGNQPRLFYRVEFAKTTIWVPVGNQPSGGLRPVTPKSQLYRFRDLLKSPPRPLNSDFRQRQKELENRVESGSCEALCETIRDLSAWNRQKPLNNYERELLRQLRSALAAEWSVASGLDINEALDEIDGYLLKGRQSAAPG